MWKPASRVNRAGSLPAVEIGGVGHPDAVVRRALATTFVLGLFYFVAVFAEFLAPLSPYVADHRRVFAPPQRIHFDSLRPFVYGFKQERNPVTRRLE